MAYKIIVIGGANADIAGVPSRNFIPRDSNIGKITVCAGGVGRNIAENLSKLGADVYLVTAVGNDIYSNVILKSCELAGINTDFVKRVDSMPSSIYLYIEDGTGDMVAAVNDMSIIDEITPEYLSSIDINAFDACVIDANLNEDTISYICENVRIPLYADPVSSEKAVRLKNKRFTAIKPNEIESRILKPYCAGRIYESHGKNGITATDGKREIQIPAKTVKVKCTTGAGDAAMAAIVIGELNGYDMKNTASFAVEYSAKVISGQ